MIWNKISKKGWYNGAIIVCIGVILYVVLMNLSTILGAVSTFIGYFKPVIMGAVFAYILSPLAKYFHRKLFRGKVFEKTGWLFSVILAVVIMLLALILLIGTLIPQLLESVTLFSNNFDSYATSLINWIGQSSLDTMIGQDNLSTLSENLLTSISGFIKENAGNIIGFAASSGKNIASIAISMILAIYLLIDVNRVVSGIKHLFYLLLSDGGYRMFRDFILRCDNILVNYIVQSLLDALIVGTVNSLFMTITGMPYVGLISVVVGVTNLIPNFGPIIGGVIGSFILLLVKPMFALMFAGFCLLLQTVDGYILKPKLFSGSLGVSGLLILISTIVLGNMFGVIGILLSIPTAAVVFFIYNDYFVAWLERRKQRAADVPK